jgi:hypothetical protein
MLQHAEAQLSICGCVMTGALCASSRDPSNSWVPAELTYCQADDTARLARAAKSPDTLAAKPPFVVSANAVLSDTARAATGQE